MHFFGSKAEAKSIDRFRRIGRETEMSELQKIRTLAAAGKVSRREFIQSSLAIGMTAGMAEMLFVRSAGAQPKKGGFCRLGFANGSTTDTLDPAFYIDTYT